MRKLFVTGCPRSGTTLLQAILADEAELYTLKETHFFKHLMRRRPLRWIDRHFWLDPARVAHSFAYIAEHNDVPAQTSNGTSAAPTDLANACARFDQLMSEMARAHNMQGWLEKSPEHMFFIDDIRQHIPGARFVHILRPGPDVVASLVDAKRKYPESWNWIGGLRRTVQLYNRYARAIRQQIGSADCFVVRYDDITSHNADVMAALARFLELSKPIDLASANTFRGDIARQDERWKIRKDAGIVDTSGEKFNTIFSEKERSFIHQNIVPTADIYSG